jgi:hypothetical protein
VHSAVPPNVVVMLDSKGRRTYPMRHFCAVTTEIKWATAQRLDIITAHHHNRTMLRISAISQGQRSLKLTKHFQPKPVLRAIRAAALKVSQVLE